MDTGCISEPCNMFGIMSRTSPAPFGRLWEEQFRLQAVPL